MDPKTAGEKKSRPNPLSLRASIQRTRTAACPCSHLKSIVRQVKRPPKQVTCKVQSAQAKAYRSDPSRVSVSESVQRMVSLIEFSTGNVTKLALRIVCGSE